VPADVQHFLDIGHGQDVRIFPEHYHIIVTCFGQRKHPFRILMFLVCRWPR
jgi:hypothetical protein